MSIEHLPNGRYKVLVDRPTASGKRKRISRTVDTKREAEVLEDQLRMRPAHADGRTVIDAVDRYLVRHATRFEPATQIGYERRANLYVRKTWIGDVRLDRLSVEDLERFYSQMLTGDHLPKARPLSHASVNSVRILLSAALNEVARPSVGWVHVEQFDGARIPAKVKASRGKRRHALADVAAICDAGGIEVEESAQLAISTSARIGELAAVRWSDVDLLTGLVSIDASVTPNTAKEKARTGQRWLRKLRKNDEPLVVRVDDACIAMLTNRYARHLEQAAVCGFDADDDLGDVAVLSMLLERDYTSPENIRQRWVAAKKKAKVSMRFHDLRHVSATAMLAGGVSVVNTQARTGHADPTTLLRVYGHAVAAADEIARAATASTWQQVQQQRKPKRKDAARMI